MKKNYRMANTCFNCKHSKASGFDKYCLYCAIDDIEEINNYEWRYSHLIGINRICDEWESSNNE
jgi:hypothetical protein